MSDEDKLFFKYPGYIDVPSKPEMDLAYGFEGMQTGQREGQPSRSARLRSTRLATLLANKQVCSME